MSDFTHCYRCNDRLGIAIHVSFGHYDVAFFDEIGQGFAVNFPFVFLVGLSCDGGISISFLLCGDTILLILNRLFLALLCLGSRFLFLALSFFFGSFNCISSLQCFNGGFCFHPYFLALGFLCLFLSSDAFVFDLLLLALSLLFSCYPLALGFVLGFFLGFSGGDFRFLGFAFLARGGGGLFGLLGEFAAFLGAPAFLDGLAAATEAFDHPMAAYNVSGEYAMVKAAAQNEWLDGRRVTMEILTSIKRAGADIIISYHSKEVARWLASEE